MRKKVLYGFMAVCLILGICGCGDKEKGPQYENKVESVMQSQIEQAKASEDASDTEDADASETVDFTPSENGLLLPDAPAQVATSDVDYDLTQMDSDMVYATVFQMMQNPSTYVGKTFRIEGLYASEYFEPTKQTYSFIIIKDAMACCSQGMEFVWEDQDGVHDISEYPKQDTDIMIEGVFDTYKEEGDNTLYCHLRNASLQVM